MRDKKDYPEYSTVVDLAGFMDKDKSTISRHLSRGKAPAHLKKRVRDEDGKLRWKWKTKETIEALEKNINEAKAKGRPKKNKEEAKDLTPDEEIAAQESPQYIQAGLELAKEFGIPLEMTLSEAQTKLYISKLAHSEFDLDIKRGKYNLSSERDEYQAQMAKLVKSSCMSFCDRVAQAITNMDKIEDITRFLRAEMKKTLKIIAEWEAEDEKKD